VESLQEQKHKAEAMARLLWWVVATACGDRRYTRRLPAQACNLWDALGCSPPGAGWRIEHDEVGEMWVHYGRAVARVSLVDSTDEPGSR
jgi:hypothetical protein